MIDHDHGQPDDKQEAYYDALDNGFRGTFEEWQREQTANRRFWEARGLNPDWPDNLPQ